MVSTGARDSGGIAVRICGSIASLQSHLVQTQLTGLDEEVRIQLHSAIGIRVNADHPSFKQVGIELVVPGAVQTVCHIHTLAITADLDHLWTAQQPAIVLGMSLFARDTTDLDLADKLGMERIGNIVLMKLARPPAGDIQEAV